MIDVEFTGSESPAEVIKAAIEVFSQRPAAPRVTVFHENGIPKMLYEYQGGDVGFSCTYRLDTMLLPCYSEAERVFDEVANLVDSDLRDPLVRYIAFGSMINLLDRLLSLQLEIFREGYAEQRVISRATFLQSVLKIRAATKDKGLLTKVVSSNVKRWIDQVIAESMKKKRAFLVGFMNQQPLMYIPTGAGRPPGSTKPEEQKAREAIEFAQQVQEAIQKLRFEKGERPTKTAVAKALGLGGLSANTGIDSSLGIFNKKLKRLRLSYDELTDDVDK